MKKYFNDKVLGIEPSAVLRSGEIDYPRRLDFGVVTLEQMKERIGEFNKGMRLQELAIILRRVAENHRREFWRFGHE